MSRKLVKRFQRKALGGMIYGRIYDDGTVRIRTDHPSNDPAVTTPSLDTRNEPAEKLLEPPMTPSQAAQEKPTSPRTRAGQSLFRGKRVHARVICDIELEAYAEGHRHATQAFANAGEAAAATPSLDKQMGLVRPACQSEHRPEHWKRGQSPRATRLVVFRDGHREYLCKRCITDAYRTARGDLVDEIDHTEPVR